MLFINKKYSIIFIGSKYHIYFIQYFIHYKLDFVKGNGMDDDSKDKNQIKKQRVASIELEWEFRYRRYLSNANLPDDVENLLDMDPNGPAKRRPKDEDWYKVYHLIGDFMNHCTSIMKQIVHKDSDLLPLDPFDHRFILKQNNQNIYYKDNIVFRVARIIVPKSDKNIHDEANIQAQLFYQEFMANDIMNDKLIELYKTPIEKDETIVKLHVPLCCIVEYLGYRAFCQADTLFHGYDTVAYGPVSELEFIPNRKVESYLFKIGEELKFKPFEVITGTGTKVKIPFSLKCQVHYYKSEKYQLKIMKLLKKQSDLYYDFMDKNEKREEYYIYGLSRLWPHFIDKGLENNVGWLRPEIQRRGTKSLDSSAFIGIASQINQESELQLADACKTVQDELTTQFAIELDKGETRYFADLLGNQKIFLIDSHSIITAFHERGINLRFLGAVANKSHMLHIKTILKIQMVAKVLKNIFYSECDANQPRLKQHLVDFLNLIFHPDKDSLYFYKTIVYPKVKEHFDYSINQFPLAVPGGGLLHAIIYHFGVKIHTIDYAFFIAQEKPPFSYAEDIEFFPWADSFHFQTSKMKQIANGYRKTFIDRDATEQKKHEKRSTKLRDLEILICYESGRRNSTTAPRGPLPESYYCALAAEICEDMGEIGRAEEFAKKALDYITQKKHSKEVIPLCVKIRYHSIKGQFIKALEYFDRALAAISYHLGQNHPLYIKVYNTIGKEYINQKDYDKADKILKKSLDICSLTLGNFHIDRSEILIILSKFQKNPLVTVDYLIQALLILESAEADTNQIKEVCKMISEKYRDIGDHPRMLEYAKKSEDKLLKIEAAERNGMYKYVMELCNAAEDEAKIPIILKSCFRAHLSTLSKQNIKKIFKYYVSFKDYAMDEKESLDVLISEMKLKNMTVAQLIEDCIDTLLSSYTKMVVDKVFYSGINKLVDSQAINKRAYVVLLTLIELFGEHEIELLFTKYI